MVAIAINLKSLDLMKYEIVNTDKLQYGDIVYVCTDKAEHWFKIMKSAPPPEFPNMVIYRRIRCMDVPDIDKIVWAFGRSITYGMPYCYSWRKAVFNGTYWTSTDDYNDEYDVVTWEELS